MESRDIYLLSVLFPGPVLIQGRYIICERVVYNMRGSDFVLFSDGFPSTDGPL